MPWGEDDFPLLVRLNAPEMTEHLGGPETDEQVLLRHQRYVAAARSGIFRDSDREYRAFIFKAVLEPGGLGVGSVNFWDREWRGEQVYEMGWGVVPEFQGRGIASVMVGLAVEVARETKRRPAVHAFPSLDNAPSNGICRRVGFELLGEERFEYPKGHWMQCNDWRLLLG
ncbi:MAG TPA: GNAT family N-acetyltransferase [Candidatus Dormibacteraeota bacterium]|nr:GNAT family N-acetyltransferase [Candidatus Dormibacteraeota bacterium]